MPQLIFSFILIFFSVGCSLFEKQPESVDRIIQKASQQRIFYASNDLVWKAAHTVIKYTIASENQDFGIIETDYIKAVDGWLPPDQTKPEYKSARYKLIFNFAKGKTDGRDSTRVTIEKKIEVFKDFISETQIIQSDGLEELALFYRIEREIIISQALKKAAASAAN
ncbi:MAG: hypothetical protein H7061_14310 [Bdellovibrionaceae bacterium]|nr:hypothetical protein [Bdellovibrio sp.]